VARSDYLPDLSAQLPGHQRRRRRRSAGIIERLDYVASLGVEAVWVSPFFKSPMADFGYDIADYRAVDPIFGTLADFDRLIARAHASAQGHRRPGSQPHLRSACVVPGEPPEPRQSEVRLVRVGRRAADGTPPNNWLSIFGGVAWTGSRAAASTTCTISSRASRT
jgi:alpha-glucosidase